MPDQVHTLTIDDLRRKVSWLFYGTRNFNSLGTTDQEVVNEIVQDGYETFLHPVVLPNEAEAHKWNFIQPFLSIVTESGTTDYGLPSNFGGFEGELFYGSSADKRYPLQKTFAERILLWRQRNSTSFTHYPTHYAIVEDNLDTSAPPVSKIMIWPTPDAAYEVTGKYYVFTPPLDDGNPYPACDQFHNQTLIEACLAKAEERLEDSQGLHATLFIDRLRSSISHDREKYAADHLTIDTDASERRLHDTDIRAEGNYVTYNGYTPGA